MQEPQAAMMNWLNSLVTHIAPIFIITSPITSYADQILSIHRSRSSAGFSLETPLIMLVASVMKVFYWFGERFSMPLLFQAFLMIFVQIILLHIALENRPPPPSHVPFHNVSSSSRPFDFWQWSRPRPYWMFLIYFCAGLAVLQVFFGPVPAYIVLLGYVALTVEAFLPIPQLMANQRRRGCKGFRVSVIANWILGDAFKMWFFFASGSGEGGVPWAFKLCGIFQACCDLALGVQWWFFGDGPEEVGRGQAHPHSAIEEKDIRLGQVDQWPKSRES